MMEHNFDDVIREKLNAFEGNFEEGAWTEMSNRLDAADGREREFTHTLFAGVVVSAALLGVFTTLPTIKSEALRMDEPREVINEPSSLSDTMLIADNLPPAKVYDIPLTDPVQSTPPSNTSSNMSSETSGDLSAAGNTLTSGSSGTPLTESGTATSTLEATDLISIQATGTQCPGSSISFKAARNKFTGPLQWLFDGIHVKDGDQVTYSFTEPGTHEVRLIGKGQNGQNVSIIRSIEIFEAPSAEISASVTINPDCFRQLVQLKSSTLNLTHRWLVDGDSMGEGQSIQINADPGLHMVTLLAETDKGCRTSFQKTVNVGAGLQLFAPTSFTPNGDDLNDSWSVIGVENAARVQTTIKRATDNKTVFTANEWKAWDGSMNGTADRPRVGEQFLWKVVVEDQCGTAKEFLGVIVIPR